MPRWLQITLHLAAIAAGAYLSVLTGSSVPLAVTTGVNAAIGTVAQSYNTDGTPQTVAFQPAVKTVNPPKS